MKLIKTKGYLLLIDEEAEIKEENIAVHDFGMGYDLETPCDKDNLKSNTRKLVIAYYPLTKEAEELDLLLLPNPFENETHIKELAQQSWGNVHRTGVLGFIEGYKAAQSKQFSLEDMKKAIEMAREIKDNKDIFDIDSISGLTEVCTYDWGERYSTEEIIQSLSTQQLPKEFIPEYEYLNCLECEGAGWMLSCNKCEGEGGEKTSKLKIIINSEGKEVVQGEWIY